MFGDPITNPMGWEIKKLGEVFEIGSSKRVYQSEWTTSGVPFYRAREIVKLARDGYVDNELFITEELYDKYAEKYGTPKVGDILVTAVGTLGVTYIVNEKDRFYYKDGNIICLHHKGAAVDSKYVDFCFKTPFVREQIDNWSGATVGTFTIVKANTTLIPLPPLSLQQSFAARVSAIEEQKALVRQSIEEARTLLASRMQYYFE
jgi:type I restriction enzyme S subunit